MNSLHRVLGLITRTTTTYPISSRASHSRLNFQSILVDFMSTNSRNDEDKWNDAWESAWLPDDLTDKSRAPWETDLNFPLTAAIASPEEIDVEAKAFVEDMNEHWNERRGKSGKEEKKEERKDIDEKSLYSLETMKKDYRLKKQRVHASLWVKEIEKLEEAKLGDSGSGGADDIDRLLDSCSEIFDSVDHDFDKLEVSSGSELKNKPDGWESTAKEQDGNLWEMSQREEDILLQEFDRRIAFCKFQIASFIKQHIFSRRRPIDGWRYMIEVIGPNARKGKGSVSRLPALSDASTQPFKEESDSLSTFKRRSNRDS
uniref:Mucin-like protein n=1 Tax=Noccaea caerulescens TaxID=107243 RepID=A0A1J3HWN1_NOCCA